MDDVVAPPIPPTEMKESPAGEDSMPRPESVEGLRKRTEAAKTDVPPPAEEAKPKKKKSMVEEALAKALDSETGKKVKVYLQMALPYAQKAAKAAHAAIPYLEKGYEKCLEFQKAIEPYHLEQYFNLVCGIILVFFGGHFVTLIACVEAVRLCGYERSKKAVMIIYKNVQLAQEASAKDDLVDDDDNGVADVKEISQDQLVTRKILLTLRTVDPDNLSHALGCLYSAYVAVMATMRLRFARAITLGTNIGNYVAKPIKRKLLPKIEPEVGPQYRKWVPVTIDYTCRFFGVTLAWIFVRFINAVNAAARGAHMLIEGIDEVARKNDMAWLADGYVDDIAAWALAVVGVLWQLSQGFYLPWYLVIPLLPFTILESVLGAVLGTYSA